MSPEKKLKRLARNLANKILRTQKRKTELIELGKTLVPVETIDPVTGEKSTKLDFPKPEKTKFINLQRFSWLSLKTKKSQSDTRRGRSSHVTENVTAQFENVDRVKKDLTTDVVTS